MCGECFTFQTPLALPGFRFNSYMCGECFMLIRAGKVFFDKFQLIYVRGMFPHRGADAGQGLYSFNSYMCGECFRRQEKGETVMHGFQLIYARGMFQHLCVVLPF